MTFTYLPGGGDQKDDIRLLIGDTDEFALTDRRLEDAEISRFLSLFGDLFYAAAEAASALANKFARLAEGSQGQERLAPMSRAQELRAAAGHLRSRAAARATPLAGGISISGKRAVEARTDRSRPSFTRTTLDHDGSRTDPS